MVINNEEQIPVASCSLHDPHCQRLFLNNCALREHLINLGLLTEDLRVVASTQEQRQRIRAHELLERKEQLIKVTDEKTCSSCALFAIIDVFMSSTLTSETRGKGAEKNRKLVENALPAASLRAEHEERRRET